jgi:hypothetical protein
MRNPTHRRLLAFLAVAATVALTISACTSGSAKVAAKEAPEVVQGIEAGVNSVKSMLGDLMGTTQGTEHELPTAFQKAADRAAAGKTLESSKEKIDALGSALQQIADTIGEAVKLDTSVLPHEASQLAAAAIYNDGGPEFATYVEGLSAKLLRGLYCNSLSKMIDSATTQQADAAGVNYDPLDGAADALDYAKQLISPPYPSYGRFVNLGTVVDGAVSAASRWVGSAQKIVESPTGQIRQANIYYFRTCVARSK